MCLGHTTEKDQGGDRGGGGVNCFYTSSFSMSCPVFVFCLGLPTFVFSNASHSSLSGRFFLLGDGGFLHTRRRKEKEVEGRSTAHFYLVKEVKIRVGRANVPTEIRKKLREKILETIDKIHWVKKIARYGQKNREISGKWKNVESERKWKVSEVERNHR